MQNRRIELRIEPWVLVAALAAVLLVGWMTLRANNPPPVSQPSPEQSNRVWVVKMVTKVSDGKVEQVFEPDRLVIAPGDTVRWELENGIHNTVAFHPGDEHADHHDDAGSPGERPLRIPAKAKPWESEHMRTPGEAFEYTFTIEGIYNYFCHPHEFDGMVGAIVVGSPKPGPGLEPPQRDLPEATQAKLKELIAWAKAQKGVR